MLRFGVQRDGDEFTERLGLAEAGELGTGRGRRQKQAYGDQSRFHRSKQGTQTTGGAQAAYVYTPVGTEVPGGKTIWAGGRGLLDSVDN